MSADRQPRGLSGWTGPSERLELGMPRQASLEPFWPRQSTLCGPPPRDNPRRCVHVAVRPLVRPPGSVTTGGSRQRTADYALDFRERKVNHRLGTSGEIPPEPVVA